jgi:hypothetical protein
MDLLKRLKKRCPDRRLRQVEDSIGADAFIQLHVKFTSYKSGDFDFVQGGTSFSLGLRHKAKRQKLFQIIDCFAEFLRSCAIDNHDSSSPSTLLKIKKAHRVPRIHFGDHTD